MKLPQNPKIIYHLNEPVLREGPKQEGDPYVFDSNGDLSVSGKTIQLAMVVNILPLGEVKEDERFKISGTTVLKMTDFGISPNLILISKTGDNVTIKFEWVAGRKDVR